MRIYLAGPTTGLPLLNAPTFDAVAAALSVYGFDVVTPIDVIRANPQLEIRPDAPIAPGTSSELVRLCIVALLASDAMALLPGWFHSREAKLALLVGQTVGLAAYIAKDLVDAGWNASPLPAPFLVTTSAHVYVNAQPGAPYSVTQADGDPSGDASRVVLGQAVL